MPTVPALWTAPVRTRESNAHEVSNRFWKAARFAAALYACRITSKTVLAFTASQWQMLATGLEENLPSQLTRAEIVSLLEIQERADEKYAHIGELA